MSASAVLFYLINCTAQALTPQCCNFFSSLPWALGCSDLVLILFFNCSKAIARLEGSAFESYPGTSLFGHTTNTSLFKCIVMLLGSSIKRPHPTERIFQILMYGAKTFWSVKWVLKSLLKFTGGSIGRLENPSWHFFKHKNKTLKDSKQFYNEGHENLESITSFILHISLQKI